MLLLSFLIITYGHFAGLWPANYTLPTGALRGAAVTALQNEEYLGLDLWQTKQKFPISTFCYICLEKYLAKWWYKKILQDRVDRQIPDQSRHDQVVRSEQGFWIQGIAPVNGKSQHRLYDPHSVRLKTDCPFHNSMALGVRWEKNPPPHGTWLSSATILIDVSMDSRMQVFFPRYYSLGGKLFLHIIGSKTTIDKTILCSPIKLQAESCIPLNQLGDTPLSITQNQLKLQILIGLTGFSLLLNTMDLFSC